METIIVPLDGSDFAERALAPARALADRCGAGVVLTTSRLGGVTVSPEAYLADAADRAGLGEARAVVAEAGIVEALGSLVAESADPVVCMTTHGRSGVAQALLGSVAEEILRRVAVPLLLVGPAVDGELATRFDTVVVCTDGSPLSEAIEPVIGSWIGALHMRVWVVQVLDPETRRALEQSGERLVEEAQVFAMARALMNRNGVGVNWDVLHGERAAPAIVGYSSDLPASLIAMTTHGRTGLARLALGSTAAAVVHEATCPVLVARPPSLDG